MQTETSRFLTAAILAVVCLACLFQLAHRREAFTSVIGDEGTYLAMIESLALDLDLEFAAADRERTEASGEIGRKYLILHRVGERFFYSKPSVYPLLAAPLYRVAGAAGPALFNFLVLALALWLAWLYLRRFGSGTAALVLTTFAGAGAVLVYVAWTMSDALQVACALGGSALCLGAIERGTAREPGIHRLFAARFAPIIGGGLLGLLVAMRITNILVAAAVIGALLVNRKWRSAWITGVAVVLMLAASVGLNTQLLDAPRPYKTQRATFDPGSGYPGGPAHDQAIARFQSALATVRVATDVRPKVSLYAALYFLVGRHSGLIAYLPAAFVFLLAALAKPDRTTFTLLFGAGCLAALYLLWLPHNYFGGGAVIGNRYFLPAYPLLLFAPTSPPRIRSQSFAWLVAAVAAISALLSVGRVQAIAPTSQSHVHAGLFRALPYESTASDIDGSAERFWLKEWELIRFADPFATVAKRSFILETGSQPAEIEIANTRPDGLMRFLVISQAERLELVYRDWRKQLRFPLTRPMGKRGVVEIDPSPTWRKHPFWFFWMRDVDFHARVFRLSIETPDGSDARAELSYLGPNDLDLDIFQRTVLETSTVAPTTPGSSTEVSVQVRNDSSEEWTSERILPIYLSYRLTGAENFNREGPRSRIEKIAPGETLNATLTVQWPERPGRYRLEVDLLVEGVVWFARRVGEPLLALEAEVASPAEIPAPRAESGAPQPPAPGA